MAGESILRATFTIESVWLTKYWMKPARTPLQ